jgi:hypothetical protein
VKPIALVPPTPIRFGVNELLTVGGSELAAAGAAVAASAASVAITAITPAALTAIAAARRPVPTLCAMSLKSSPLLRDARPKLYQ